MNMIIANCAWNQSLNLKSATTDYNIELRLDASNVVTTVIEYDKTIDN